MAKNALIIDDSVSIRQVVSLTLGSAGWNVREAGDGAAALQSLQSDADIQLIISDVNMPVMNGIEFLKKLKSDPAYEAFRFIPVMMLTTESEESMKEEGRKAGARAWLVKPFQPDRLLAAVAKLTGDGN